MINLQKIAVTSLFKYNEISNPSHQSPFNVSSTPLICLQIKQLVCQPKYHPAYYSLYLINDLNYTTKTVLFSSCFFTNLKKTIQT
jgi:hypothetical protein